jgi:hypothetical protein
VTPSRELLEAAVSLRAVAPELWERFLVALRTHSALTTAEMTRCDPQLLMRAQGMAIAMSELVGALVSAHEQLEKTRTR